MPLLRFLRIPVVFRIATGLISLLYGALLAASYLGFFPDAIAQTQRHRTEFCESAAVGFSLMAEKTDVGTMRKYLETLAKRCSGVKSLGVRRDRGKLLVETGNHDQHWLGPTPRFDGSQVSITLQAHGKPWGTLEAVFTPLRPANPLALWAQPELAHAMAVASMCLIAFYIYLRIVLRQLDPKRVIPNRVRDALDALAEGLVILDCHERIVLANRVFEDTIRPNKDSMLGAPISNIPFVSRDETQDSPSAPWRDAMHAGDVVRGRLLGINREGIEPQTFSVSAAPIRDEKGASRGILASFQDVTRLEQKKKELRSMVDNLRESSETIKQQNRELERLATRDPLTGCLNRRSFFESFDTHWKTAERYQHPLSAMMVDIDFFKSINDNHGHATGDEVLRRVATTLTAMARDSDIVCRYGGEEFAILLPMTNADEAATAAERMRVAIEQISLPGFGISASIGVAARTADVEHPQDLLEQADKCLYVAKRNGRNRVIRWDDVPPDTVIAKSTISRIAEVSAAEETIVPYHAVTALISALSFRDHVTAAHSGRVADLCVSMADGLMSRKDCYTLEIAALLHDIGKIAVPDNIMLKPGPLTPEEWKVMLRNDMVGKEIIRASFTSQQLTTILDHYQAHYGNGAVRPSSPTGKDIPLGARILAIADAYDSMTTDRPYRKARSPNKAFSELRRYAGKQFDPELVERFIEIVIHRETAQRQTTTTVSKETALCIGLQIERLTAVLDKQDFDSLDAICRHLQLTANKHAAGNIAGKAKELGDILDADRDPHTILRTALELLEMCRSTQQAFLAPQAI